MYVMDIETDILMEIDYMGNRVRDIFTAPRLASRLALSYYQSLIMWYEVPSAIHVQGLVNQSLSILHTLSGEHVVGIEYYGGKMYWVQRSPVISVYCKMWNETSSEGKRLRMFQNTEAVNDIAVVNASSQPQPSGLLKHCSIAYYSRMILTSRVLHYMQVSMLALCSQKILLCLEIWI